MNDSDQDHQAHRSATLVLMLATLAFAVAATAIMFSAFAVYDDEGYVLLSLRNFADHGALYRDVYSQYGPFPFVAYGTLSALGIPLTHTVGRLITVALWATTALGCAVLVRNATRSLPTALAVLAGVFVYLWVISHEPSHPGGIIVLITTLIAVFGHRCITRGQTQHWGALVGVAIALLLLTKINIGLFAAYSAVAWWLLHHRNDTVRRWAPVLAATMGAFLPFALMRPLLGTPWVHTYAVVFACSAIATVFTARIGATPQIGSSALGIGLLAAGSTAIIVLGVVSLRGTTPFDLLEGLLLGPLRLPGAFSTFQPWPSGMILIAGTSLVTCVAACYLRTRHTVSVDRFIAGARVVLVGLLAFHLLRFPPTSPDASVFAIGLPFIWVGVWSHAGENPTRAGARAWLALLLLAQCLHPFPVAGSQRAWGSFLILPLAALAASDAAKVLFSPSTAPYGRSRRTITAITLTVLLGFTALIGWNFSKVALRIRQGENLRLPGAELIRVAPHSAAALRVMAQNAAAHADVLFSMPGMFSFNLWTDVPPPTLTNVTHWYLLLDETRQRAIVEKLKSHPKACVIVDPAHLRFLVRGGVTPRGPLYDYLLANFEAAFAVGHFEFHVHRGRAISPLMVADLLSRTDEGQAGAEGTMLRFTTPALSRAISRVVLTPDASGAPEVSLHAGNSRVEVAAVHSPATPPVPPRTAPWPIALHQPSVVSIYFARRPAAVPDTPGTITLRDDTGAEIGLARLRP